MGWFSIVAQSIVSCPKTAESITLASVGFLLGSERNEWLCEFASSPSSLSVISSSSSTVKSSDGIQVVVVWLQGQSECWNRTDCFREATALQSRLGDDEHASQCVYCLHQNVSVEGLEAHLLWQVLIKEILHILG